MSNEKHRRYTAGFLFYRQQVLLVRKKHPLWQAGLMNAVGGEIEEGESPMVCMVREFREEANLHSTMWDFFASEHGPGYEVYFYRLFIPSDDHSYTAPAKNDKGEELEWCTAIDIKYPVVGNLHWLIPLALDPRPFSCVVRTTGDIRKLATW
jgi:8-oxo-dGTP pyrophosphatase MutT (NUDIX family)